MLTAVVFVCVIMFFAVFPAVQSFNLIHQFSNCNAKYKNRKHFLAPDTRSLSGLPETQT